MKQNNKIVYQSIIVNSNTVIFVVFVPVSFINNHGLTIFVISENIATKTFSRNTLYENVQRNTLLSGGPRRTVGRRSRLGREFGKTDGRRFCRHRTRNRKKKKTHPVTMYVTRCNNYHITVTRRLPAAVVRRWCRVTFAERAVIDHRPQISRVIACLRPVKRRTTTHPRTNIRSLREASCYQQRSNPPTQPHPKCASNEKSTRPK